MNKVHYEVTGLLNSTVKTQVKHVLDEIDGVQKVDVDLVNSTIDVGYGDSTDESEIKKNIEHVGCKLK